MSAPARSRDGGRGYGSRAMAFRCLSFAVVVLLAAWVFAHASAIVAHSGVHFHRKEMDLLGAESGAIPAANGQVPRGSNSSMSSLVARVHQLEEAVKRLSKKNSELQLERREMKEQVVRLLSQVPMWSPSPPPLARLLSQLPPSPPPLPSTPPLYTDQAVPPGKPRDVVAPLQPPAFKGQSCYDPQGGARDFRKDPVLVAVYGPSDRNTPSSDFGPGGCSMPCYQTKNKEYRNSAEGHICIHMGGCSPGSLPGSLRCEYEKRALLSMESHAYYPSYIPQPDQLEQGLKNIEYFMNHYLASSIPAGYNDWPLWSPERIQGLSHPPEFKEKEWDVIAVISNCQTQHNSRLDVIKKLEKIGPDLGLSVGFFGGCSTRGRYKGSKMDLMRKAKFTLAIENSFVHDYVTEKFFEPLWAGSVPIVAGTDNIKEYYPAPGAVVNLDTHGGDARRLAQWLAAVAHDEKRYMSFHSWRATLGTESFRALMDIGITHSVCRFCIKFADDFQTRYSQRPVSRAGLLVRERNTFEFREIQLPQSATLQALRSAVVAAFRGEAPVFASRRIWDGQHRLYRIYYAYVTSVDEALNGGPNVIASDTDVGRLMGRGAGSHLEVIFV